MKNRRSKTEEKKERKKDRKGKIKRKYSKYKEALAKTVTFGPKGFTSQTA